MKERYPSLALVNKDREQCNLMLNNYEELLQSKSICEGRCALGEECPTGICRSQVQQQQQPTRQRRHRSTSSHSELTRSFSTASTSSTSSTRPRSGPPGLRSYTGYSFIILCVRMLDSIFNTEQNLFDNLLFISSPRTYLLNYYKKL